MLILYWLLTNVQFVPFHGHAIFYKSTLEETINVEGFVIQFFYPIVTFSIKYSNRL